MNNHINFRTATAPRTTAPAPRVPRIDPPKAPNTDHEAPRRSPRNWMLPVGLAVVASAAIVGLVVQTTTDDVPANDTPTEVGNVRIDTDAERPSDLVVSGWYTTRTYDEPAIREADTGTDAERPSDLVVGGWYTTRTYDEPAIENTAAPALAPAIIGEPVALAGTVSCIPFQALGPNADLAPDPTGQRSSGVEILDELRQRGPNADLSFDPNGQRSSGHDPICVGG